MLSNKHILIFNYYCVVYLKFYIINFFPEGHCCPIYDEGIGRVVEDYSRPCPDCSFQYYSDEIIESRIGFVFYSILKEKVVFKN